MHIAEREPLTESHNHVELLAPAGGPEALVAAVNNGADAVYLGLPDLNARRGAANFDLTSLEEAARFAHLRGARVYLTANVVVLEAELASALQMIEKAWEAGVDAVIVQDLGLLRALRESLPHVRVHSSTQIDAMNPEAVAALAKAGASRVTLARELSFDGIAACAATGVEVETFVHGALCYCYSGQCLMSSLIGRRSANRGLCAQPCRLPYELLGPNGEVADVPGRYLLSTRDLAGIAHLPELIAAGVRALKIEGRMKSPEYVAVVTGVYRAALDRALADPSGYGVPPAEWDMLEEAFSRGFTDGYLTGKRGAELMSYTRPNNRGVLLGRIVSAEGRSVRLALERALDPEDTLEVWTRSGRFAQPAGRLSADGRQLTVAPAGSTVQLTLEEPASAGDRVFRVANAALLRAARRTFTGASASDLRAVPVAFDVRVRVGQPLRIGVVAAGTSVELEGEVVAEARTKAISADDVIEHVGRLGGSGYSAESWSIDLDAGAGLGFSALHNLRRQALDQLDALRLRQWTERTAAHVQLPKLPAAAPRADAPALVATVWDEAAAEACLSAGADRVLMRVFGPPTAVSLPDRVQPLLPRIVWPDEVARYAGWLGGDIVAGNLGTLASATGRVEADWPLNVVNPYAAAELAEMGAAFVWASPELSGRQLAALVREAPVPVGFVIWGRTELMVAEQCVLQAAGACGRRCASCARAKSWWRLRDQKGYEFPVTTDPSGRAHIANSVTLDLVRALPEIVAAGVSAVRLDFTDESPQRMRGVISGVRAALDSAVRGGTAATEPLVSPSTSGHFYRGLA